MNGAREERERWALPEHQRIPRGTYRENQTAITPHPGKQPGAASGTKSVPADNTELTVFGNEDVLLYPYRELIFTDFGS